MAPKFVMGLLDKLAPTEKPGKTLLVLNAVGMAAAAATDTFAAAVDKDTKAEDKKFLIPAGVATGVAKLGIYYGMTTKIIDANAILKLLRNLFILYCYYCKSFFFAMLCKNIKFKVQMKL